MGETPANVKGMNDILPPEVSKWQFVEEKARGVLESFAFREARTPILEYTPLFVRSVGEETDVVGKQMYTFDDRDGRSVTMRPEGTAPVVRSYLAEAQWNKEPVTRWYYLGPMFRHERAQRGRLRQFHQIGAEIFGVAEPSVDAEMIGMLVGMLVEFGIPRDKLEVAMNSLGEPEERTAYRDRLVAYLRQHEAALDEESRRRLETNPLRILDSKSPEVQQICAKAPVLLETLGGGSRERFQTVLAHLGRLGVKAEVEPRLVRGLDYYTSTIFEIRTSAGSLGAQNTLTGGGRYDRLVESLGGPKMPALGFGLGIERVLLALPEEAASFEPALAVFVAALDAPAVAFALPIVQRLRLDGVRTEIEHRGGSLKSQLKRADKLKARVALIVGENEVAAKKVQLKDLATGKQDEVAEADLPARIRQMLD